MFGYLFPTKDVLTMPEKKIFADYFCTLCLAHQYRYGRLSSLLNNYDLAVFAIVLNLYGENIEDCGKCGKKVAHKKDKFTDGRWGNIVDYNINLMRKKMEDDCKDMPSLKATFTYLGASGIFAKCRKRNPVLYEAFDIEFNNFLNIEAQKPSLIDILDAYENFSRNTFGLLDCVLSEQVNLFASLNRWVYWIDAIDDIEKDYNTGSYNPYLHHVGAASKVHFLQNNMPQLILAYKTLKHEIDSAYSLCCYPTKSRIIIENIKDHTIRNTTRLILENGSIAKRRRLL